MCLAVDWDRVIKYVHMVGYNAFYNLGRSEFPSVYYMFAGYRLV